MTMFLGWYFWSAIHNWVVDQLFVMFVTDMSIVLVAK